MARRSSELIALALTACTQGVAAPAPAPGSDAARAPAPVIASLDDADGDVRCQRAAEAAWARAVRGLGLSAGDSVQTMVAATALVRFAGTGAIASLGPQTTMRIPAQVPEVVRLHHVSGRLVARIPEAGAAPLEVELPPGTFVLEPRSSRREGPGGSVEAQIDVRDEHTHIEMLRGAGRLERPHAATVRVEEERFVELARDGGVVASGRTGATAAPSAPADGAHVRTRRATRFAWAPVAGADSVRLVVVPDGGAASQWVVPASEAGLAVELPSGTYRWTVAGVVAGEPLPSSAPRVVVVEVDQAAPPLVVESPVAGTTTSGANVRVAGHTDPDAKVEVDGRPVSVDAEGAFSASVPVPRGLTNLVVAAADDLGNVRAVSRTVLRE